MPLSLFSRPGARRAARLLLAAGVLGLAPAARAADGVWSPTPTDGDWSTSANWTGGTIPGVNDGSFTSQDTATFNAASSTTLVVVDPSRNVKNVTFDTASAAAYTIGATNGNALLLTTGGAVTINAAVVTPQVVNAPLVIGGTAYTFANNSTTAASSLTIGGGVTGGTAGAAVVLTLQGTNVTGGGTITGVIDEGAAASLAVTKTGSGNWTLAGANAYDGLTTVSQGILNVRSNTALGSTAGATTVAAGASLQIQNNITVSEALTINAIASTNTLPNGLVSVSGVNEWAGAITANAGTSNVRISVLAGSTLTLSGAITTTGTAALVLTGPTTAANTQSGTISGTARLISTVSGTNGSFALSGTNTFTGRTEIQNGTFRVTSINSVNTGGGATLASSSLGAPTTAAEGQILLGNGGTAGTLVYLGTGETTNRQVVLNGTTGGGVIDQSGTTGVLTFTAATAAVGIGSKTLTLQGSAAGSGVFAGVIANNATVGSTPLSSNFSTGAGTITLNSVDGVAPGAAISGAGLAGGTTVTAVNTATRVVTLSAATTAGGTSGATITVAGVVNATRVAKSGTGTWTLSGANTYTGGTTLGTGGVLNINNGGTSASNSAIGTGAFTVGGNGSFDNTSGAAITLQTNNPINLSGGSPTFVGTNDLTFGTGAVTLSGANRSLTVSNAAALLTLNGAVGGAFGFTKLGAGTLLLGGGTAYTGATNVTAGTLLLNGATTATTGVTVAAAGTLGGGGSVAAAVGSAGRVQGGTGTAPTGTLSLAAGLTFTGTAGSFRTAVAGSPGAAAASLVAVTGDLVTPNTGAGAVAINLFDAGLTDLTGAGGSYTVTVATYTGTLTGTAAVFSVVAPANFAFQGTPTVSATGGVVSVMFTPVPVHEPATALGLAAGGLGLAGWVRRRRAAARG